MGATKKQEKKVIFTDLDGTLIDHKTYSYIDASKTLKELKKRNVPIILCTSKTRAEIEKFKEKLILRHPFIAENGGAIFIPKDYFSFDYSFDKKVNKYNVIELGTPILELKKVTKSLKKNGLEIKTFSDMSVNELSKDTGLTKMDAIRAKKREYDIAFKILEPQDKDLIIKTIEKEGYKVSAGGRYHHLTGSNDKGHAVKILTDLFRRKYNNFNITTIGLGDGENDIPMLKNVDIPILVKNREHKKPELNFDVIYTMFEGPKGWSEAIDELW
ncbi:MAG: HAD-IIB family hydrolase, partial [Nanohaloarchaea archaeon]|nr:HAD-IIB family hydrolase [Candidatus Nanohaloarchaea archaeon]